MKKILYLVILLFGLFSCDTLGQSKPIGEIPFTINENGSMIIELHINNEKISNFVLDTGASVAVLDDDIATRLNLTFQEVKLESTGPNGVTNSSKKTAEQEISITDQVVLEDIKLSVTD